MIFAYVDMPFTGVIVIAAMLTFTLLPAALGFAALRRIDREPQVYRGRRLAVGAIIMGVLGFFMAAVIGVFVLWLAPSPSYALMSAPISTPRSTTFSSQPIVAIPNSGGGGQGRGGRGGKGGDSLFGGRGGDGGDGAVLPDDAAATVSLVFNNGDVRDVIKTIAVQAKKNIVLDADVTGYMTIHTKNMQWNDALNLVCEPLNLVVTNEADNTIRIAKQKAATSAEKPAVAQPIPSATPAPSAPNDSKSEPEAGQPKVAPQARPKNGLGKDEF